MKDAFTNNSTVFVSACMPFKKKLLRLIVSKQTFQVTVVNFFYPTTSGQLYHIFAIQFNVTI